MRRCLAPRRRRRHLFLSRSLTVSVKTNSASANCQNMPNRACNLERCPHRMIHAKGISLIAGIELLHRIRKGQFDLCRLGVQG
jgi:hypothetical protein